MFNKLNSEYTRSVDWIIRHLDQFCRSKNLRAIKSLHGHLLRTGLLAVSPTVHTKVILSYTTFLHTDNNKTLASLFKFFNPQDPLPFNWIISHFCRNGFSSHALKTLYFMHANDVPLDTYALCSALTATNHAKDINFGKQIHARAAKSGWLSSVFVGSALVDLYAKGCIMNDAHKVFDEISLKNTVCANALLSGYCEARFWNEGLDLVLRMPSLGLMYDNFTLAAILRACAGLSATALGRQVHGYLLRNDHDLMKDVFLLSSLIEMYGRCGLVDKAWQVFNFAGIREQEKKRDIVLWTSLIGVYGKNGHYEKVIESYDEMLVEGIKPDQVAFVTIISACAHTGQLELGIKHFESMISEYDLDPGPEHYGCVVDLLCRAGELDRASDFINSTARKGHGNSSISMWGALLSACEDRGNIELGRLAAQRALELEPHNVGIYVMLSNLYAKFSMWEDIRKLRKMIREKGFQKDSGRSWIEVLS